MFYTHQVETRFDHLTASPKTQIGAVFDALGENGDVLKKEKLGIAEEKVAEVHVKFGV